MIDVTNVIGIGTARTKRTATIAARQLGRDWAAERNDRPSGCWSSRCGGRCGARSVAGSPNDAA